MTTVVYKERGKFLYKPVFDKSYDSTYSYAEGETEASATSRIRIRAPYMDMLFGTPNVAGEFTEPIGCESAEREVLLGLTDDPASLKVLKFIKKMSGSLMRSMARWWPPDGLTMRSFRQCGSFTVW